MAVLDKDNEVMRILLEESDYAFKITMQSGGVANSDYADYTSNNFINSFRHIMQKPDLSRAQLASMLRAAERNRKRDDQMADSWSKTMASVMRNTANINTTQQ